MPQSYVPPLRFDPRDRKGVENTIPETTTISDPWSFARAKAKMIFTEMLAENSSFRDYLGGTPSDTAAKGGFMDYVSRGLCVSFELAKDNPALGTFETTDTNSEAVRDGLVVVGKFWIAANRFPAVE